MRHIIFTMSLFTLFACGSKGIETMSGGVGVGSGNKYETTYAKSGYLLEYRSELTLATSGESIELNNSALVTQGQELVSSLRVENFSDEWFRGKDINQKTLDSYLQHRYRNASFYERELVEGKALCIDTTISNGTHTDCFVAVEAKSILVKMTLNQYTRSPKAELLRQTILSFRSY